MKTQRLIELLVSFPQSKWKQKTRVVVNAHGNAARFEDHKQFFKLFFFSKVIKLSTFFTSFPEIFHKTARIGWEIAQSSVNGSNWLDNSAEIKWRCPIAKAKIDTFFLSNFSVDVDLTNINIEIWNLRVRHSRKKYATKVFGIHRHKKNSQTTLDLRLGSMAEPFTARWSEQLFSV